MARFIMKNIEVRWDELKSKLNSVHYSRQKQCVRGWRGETQILFRNILLLVFCRKLIISFIITQQKFLMTDVQILHQFDDRVLHTPIDQQDPQKLPKIDRGGSRDGARSKAEKRKTPPLLPSIKQPAVIPPLQSSTPPQAEPQPDSFAMQIEERLRMVLQNVNQGEEMPMQSGEESEVDFQALIQQNKEKLKLKQRQSGQTREGKPRSNTLKNKNQNSIYEKRMKEYRDASTENKFIQKRKEIIALKQEAIERGNDKPKQMKQKQDNIKNSSSGVPKPNIPKGNNRLKYSAKERKPQEAQQLAIPNQARTADLFDNIHHFLEHPHKGKLPNDIRRDSKDNIKELAEKIKQLNQKLGVKEQEGVEGQTKGVIEQKTVLDWKRLQYNRGSNFRCHYDSNFQKQVDRIGSLQQKTSHSLNRFLDHQKTLVALTLMKKVSKKPEQRTT